MTVFWVVIGVIVLALVARAAYRRHVRGPRLRTSGSGGAISYRDIKNDSQYRADKWI